MEIALTIVGIAALIFILEMAIVMFIAGAERHHKDDQAESRDS